MTNQALLVSAAQDATIRFWDAATGDQKYVIDHHKESQVNCMAISPDNCQIVAATWEKIRFFDINNLSRTNNIPPMVHEKNVTTLGYQAEGVWIYTGGEDGMAKIWDMRQSQLSCQRIFQLNTPIHCVALHPNQIELIVADSTGALYLWDLRSDRDDSLLTEVEISEYVVHVEIDQTGRQCAAITNRGHLFIWNIHSGTLAQVQQMSAGTDQDSEQFDPQNVPDYSSFTDSNGQPLMMLQPLGQAPPIMPLDNMSLYSGPYGVSAMSANAPYTLMSNIRPSAKVTAHNTFGLKCHFTPNGLYVATTSADHTAKIWSATDYSLQHTFTMPTNKWVWDCQFTNDSRYAITASSDGLLRMWDVQKETKIRDYEGHSKAITAMCFKDFNY